jgi:hypothetical protein
VLWTKVLPNARRLLGVSRHGEELRERAAERFLGISREDEGAKARLRHPFHRGEETRGRERQRRHGAILRRRAPLASVNPRTGFAAARDGGLDACGRFRAAEVARSSATLPALTS